MHYSREAMSELGCIIFDILHVACGGIDNIDADLDGINWSDEKHIDILVRDEIKRAYLADIVRMAYGLAIITDITELENLEFRISFTGLDIPNGVKRRDLTFTQAAHSHYDYLKRRGEL